MMKALLTIVHVSPLLGLLGTVIGMYGIFGKMKEAQGGAAFSSVEQMSGPISIALITTICGLCVAIPTYMAYNYLRQKIDNILIEMEKAAVEIIYFLTLPEEDQLVQQRPATPPNSVAGKTAY